MPRSGKRNMKQKDDTNNKYIGTGYFWDPFTFLSHMRNPTLNPFHPIHDSYAMELKKAAEPVRRGAPVSRDESIFPKATKPLYRDISDSTLHSRSVSTEHVGTEHSIFPPRPDEKVTEEGHVSYVKPHTVTPPTVTPHTKISHTRSLSSNNDDDDDDDPKKAEEEEHLEKEHRKQERLEKEEQERLAAEAEQKRKEAEAAKRKNKIKFINDLGKIIKIKNSREMEEPLFEINSIDHSMIFSRVNNIDLSDELKDEINRIINNINKESTLDRPNFTYYKRLIDMWRNKKIAIDIINYLGSQNTYGDGTPNIYPLFVYNKNKFYNNVSTGEVGVKDDEGNQVKGFIISHYPITNNGKDAIQELIQYIENIRRIFSEDPGNISIMTAENVAEINDDITRLYNIIKQEHTKAQEEEQQLREQQLREEKERKLQEEKERKRIYINDLGMIRGSKYPKGLLVLPLFKLNDNNSNIIISPQVDNMSLSQELKNEINNIIENIENETDFSDDTKSQYELNIENWINKVIQYRETEAAKAAATSSTTTAAPTSSTTTAATPASVVQQPPPAPQQTQPPAAIVINDAGDINFNSDNAKANLGEYLNAVQTFYNSQNDDVKAQIKRNISNFLKTNGRNIDVTIEKLNNISTFVSNNIDQPEAILAIIKQLIFMKKQLATKYLYKDLKKIYKSMKKYNYDSKYFKTEILKLNKKYNININKKFLKNILSN